MTEMELIESSATYNGLMQGWVSAYFAAFTGYCIVAYLAGSKLTTRQAAFVGGCYVVFSCLCIFGAYGAGMLMTAFANEVEVVNPQRSFVANFPVIYISVAIFVTTMFGSLKFMWDIRHPKTE
jgi:hypothetical protein